ncbi:MAG: hypothetical protein Q9218_006644 [Villophora microphyllina]
MTDSRQRCAILSECEIKKESTQLQEETSSKVLLLLIEPQGREKPLLQLYLSKENEDNKEKVSAQARTASL